MTAAQIKSEMAVWSSNGNSYDCGYGLYDFRLHHTESDYRKAEHWCADENKKLAERAK